MSGYSYVSRRTVQIQTRKEGEPSVWLKDLSKWVVNPLDFYPSCWNVRSWNGFLWLSTFFCTFWLGYPSLYNFFGIPLTDKGNCQSSWSRRREGQYPSHRGCGRPSHQTLHKGDTEFNIGKGLVRRVPDTIRHGRWASVNFPLTSGPSKDWTKVQRTCGAGEDWVVDDTVYLQTLLHLLFVRVLVIQCTLFSVWPNPPRT